MTEAAPSHLLCHAVYSVGCTIHLLLRLWRKASINEVPEYHGHANRNITRMHDTDPSTTCGASWTWSIVNKLMRSRFNFFSFDFFLYYFSLSVGTFSKGNDSFITYNDYWWFNCFYIAQQLIFVCMCLCVCVRMLHVILCWDDEGQPNTIEVPIIVARRKIPPWWLAMVRNEALDI